MKFGVFQLGDVTFEPTTRTLTDKDGHHAQLRNKSKEVLACLLKTPNQTVTKAEILDSVWSDVTVSDESLVQCVADIRRIIGNDARKILETVPREGYRINLPEQAAKPKRATLIAASAALVVTLAIAWFLWPITAAVPSQQEASNNTPSATTPAGH